MKSVRFLAILNNTTLAKFLEKYENRFTITQKSECIESSLVVSNDLRLAVGRWNSALHILAKVLHFGIIEWVELTVLG
jgi:hypothetical protein